jgi:hypothetical protein
MLPVQEISDDTLREMIALYEKCFERWPVLAPEVSSLEHLRWKMSGPASPLGSYQGRLGGKLVYCATALTDWVRVAGRRCVRVVFLDACVDPSCRGRGVYSRSVTYRTRVARYRCDLSLHEGSPSARVERRLARQGQTRLGNRITKLIRVLGSEAPLHGLLRGAGFLRRPLASALKAAGSLVAALRGNAAPSLTATTVTVFDDRFDALFAAAASRFDYIGERTCEHLRWRYGDRRAGPYQVRALEEHGELLGWAVSRTAGPRAYLVDLLGVPDRPDIVEALAADAVAVARARGSSQLMCWLPRRHPYRRALFRQGFFDSRQDPGVGFHAVEMPPEELAPLADASAAIHFGLGDTDLA